MSSQGQSIVEIKQMGDALRSSGYKSIDSAIAEIIDNSIEANAHDVFVIMNEKVDPNTGRKCIYEFGILDNGDGMSIDKLAKCLGIGVTTKFERRGMGRFGVGLPQASLHVTPSVEVYSWEDEIDLQTPVNMVWLDINKVKTGEQEVIEPPKLTDIPAQFLPFLQYHVIDRQFDFTKHGTLVYWKNCDNVKPKTMSSLNDKLEFAIGRKFRHLICEGKHNIRLITIGHEETAIDVLPNDPLFLMKPNYVLGDLTNPGNISPRANYHCTEPIFEPFTDEYNNTGTVLLPIPYTDRNTGEKKTSNVEIRFSKVRSQFYDSTAFPSGNPGSTPLGTFVKKNEGISVVRANREIDFGSFGFYDKENTPYHRWWGCEICFDPVLDELFGVANNKQQVELHDDRSDRDDDAEESLWDSLARIIKENIKKMVDANKEIRKGTRGAEDGGETASESERIIDNVEDELGDKEGQAQQEREQTPAEVLEGRVRDHLIEKGIENPTAEQIKDFLNQDISIEYKNNGKLSPFIDTDFSLGKAVVTLNTAHVFYSEFVDRMDDDAKVAFELFIGALAHAIDKTNIHNRDQNDQLVQEWDYRLKQYLQRIKSN